MEKEKKDKIEKLEAEIGRMYILNDKLAGQKSDNLQRLTAKVNKLQQLKEG